MKITLTGDDFNRIMRACGPACEKSDAREALRHIEICCNGQGEGVATAMDGFILAQTRFPCQDEKGALLLRPHKAVRNDCIMEICQEDGMISVSDGTETTTRSACTEAYINHATICKNAQRKKPRMVISFSTRVLKRLLESFGGERVSLEMRGPHDAVIVQSSNGAYGLVMPMKIGSYKEPEFLGEEDERQ